MKRKHFVLTLALAAFLLVSALPLTAAAATKSDGVYTDISGAWYTDAAAEYGYPEIFSTDNGKFYPDRQITRMEFVRLLHKALEININYFAAPDIRDSFSDMKNTDTGSGDLIDLVTAGIIKIGGAFSPDKPLDRETMIHWIMNALKSHTGGGYPIPMVKPVPFKDDDRISEAYRSEIYSAVVLKLVYGRGDNMINPKDGALRCEAVTVVKRLNDLLESYQGGVYVTASAWLVKGGDLAMSLTVRNNTDKDVAINHTSGQRFDFKLYDAEDNLLYTWSADKSFMAMMTSTVLKPGENIVFSDTLDSSTYDAVKSAVIMRAYIMGTSEDFSVDEAGYAAVIAK